MLCSVTKFCFACLVALLSTLGAARLVAAPKPNILFIAVDDLNAALGCYGDLMAQTPNIDRLSQDGVLFRRAYNQLPLCNPSRASVMTGLRPDQLKVYDLDRHFRDEVPEVETMSQRFRRGGWRTARVGKIYHYNVPASIGTDGFDDPHSWDETINPLGRDKKEEALIFNAEPHRKISAALSWLAADGEDQEQTDGMIATEAIRWMSSHRDKPFFLGVGFFRPHTPYVAPKKYFELYPLDTIQLPYAPEDDRADIPTAAFAHNCPIPNYDLPEAILKRAIQAYYASVSFVDAQIGRLLGALENLGMASETIVVFWSDHGYHLGEHDGVWQKRTLFERSALAPLIIRMPGARGNGRASNRIVEFIDIYPTLVECAGLTQPQHLAGRSLARLLDDPEAIWNHFAFTQILRPADDRLSEPVMGRSVRDNRWRYTEWNGGEQGRELYDYATDPGEFRNLALHPDSVAEAQMKRLRNAFEGRVQPRAPKTPFNPARL